MVEDNKLDTRALEAVSILFFKNDYSEYWYLQVHVKCIS